MYINTSLSQRLDRETDRQTNRQAGRQTGTILPLRNPHVKSWADRHTHLVTYSGDTCSQPRLPTEQPPRWRAPHRHRPWAQASPHLSQMLTPQTGQLQGSRAWNLSRERGSDQHGH